jgi:ABC-2 type transport system ATP-binding protein
VDGKATQGAAVSARGLGMDGPRGPVYGDVTFDAPPGTLVAVRGPAGSGRTCLLLTRTGRMRPGTGRAEVDGHQLPRRAAAVRRIAALGPVTPLTDLEPALSVAEHLHERTLLARRFTASPLAAAGLDPAALPRGTRTRVRDLGQLDVFRLGVALALSAAPRLLAVDDVGHKLTADEHAAARLDHLVQDHENLDALGRHLDRLHDTALHWPPRRRTWTTTWTTPSPASTGSTTAHTRSPPAPRSWTGAWTPRTPAPPHCTPAWDGSRRRRQPQRRHVPAGRRLRPARGRPARGRGADPGLLRGQRDARTGVMADPVALATATTHAAPHYGTGFAPYFIPLALWVGAMVGSMLLPASTGGRWRPAHRPGGWHWPAGCRSRRSAPYRPRRC